MRSKDGIDGNGVGWVIKGRKIGRSMPDARCRSPTKLTCHWHHVISA